MLEKLKFWKETEEEVEATAIEKLEAEIDAAVSSLAGYTTDSEQYRASVENIKRLVELHNQMIDENPEPKGLMKILSNVWDAVRDPRVIAAGISSAVYVWWGKTCMKYDADGNIPPTRMLNNGPKPPKQQA